MEENKKLEGVMENQTLTDESLDFDPDEIKKGIESNVDELVEELEERLEDIEELTDEEKKEIYIQQLKASILHHKPITHKGNVTINTFGKAKKKHRQKRNKMRKTANKRNR